MPISGYALLPRQALPIEDILYLVGHLLGRHENKDQALSDDLLERLHQRV